MVSVEDNERYSLRLSRYKTAGLPRVEVSNGEEYELSQTSTTLVTTGML